MSKKLKTTRYLKKFYPLKKLRLVCFGLNWFNLNTEVTHR